MRFAKDSGVVAKPVSQTRFFRRSQVRKNPIDSPEAAGRIVALALLADGAIDRRETVLLERQQILKRLGLDNERFDAIYYEYCTDLLANASREASGQLALDEQNIKKLLGEIRDPELQRKMLRIMLDIVHADHRLTAGEATLIAQALQHWEIDLCGMSESATPRHCTPPETRDIPSSTSDGASGGCHANATG